MAGYFTKIIVLLLSLFIIDRISARQKRLVNMQTLDYTLNLFCGCDIYLLSETIELENYHQIKHPVSLYTNFNKFNDDFDSNPNLYVGIRLPKVQAKKAGVPLSSLSAPSLLKARNCKVQITALVPEEKPNYRTFVYYESVQLYYLVIHFVPRSIAAKKIPIFRQSLKLIIRAMSRMSYSGDGRYYYHMISYISTPKSVGIRSKLPQWLVTNFYLLSVCHRCKEKLTLLRFFDLPDLPIAQTIQECEPHNHNAIHREALHYQYMHSVVSVHLPQEVYYAYFYQGYKSWTKIANSEPRRIISERIQDPHAVLIWDLKKRYSNMSFSIHVVGVHIDTDERLEDFQPQPLNQSFDDIGYNHEVIDSPGVYGDSKWSTLFILTNEVALTFVTSGNVTVAVRSAIFSAPFDQATWSLLLMTTVLLAITVIATSGVQGNPLLRLLNAFLMMWRILLENFNYESASTTTTNRRMLLVVTTTLAMMGVVLTNGYKGVLTSDLSFAPKFSGPQELKQIIEANWTKAAFTYYTGYDRKNSVFQNWNELTVLPIMAHVLREYSSNNIYSRKEYNVSGFDPQSIGLSTVNVEEIVEELTYQNFRKNAHIYTKCNLTQAVFLIFKPKSAPLSELYLPRACYSQLRNKPFVVGKQSFLPAGQGWGAGTRHHPGKVFQSIKTLVETGIHSEMEKLLRKSAFNLKVVDYVVQTLDPLPPKPLNLDNALISSTFSLWGRLVLAAIILVILEKAVAFFRLAFSYEEVVQVIDPVAVQAMYMT